MLRCFLYLAKQRHAHKPLERFEWYHWRAIHPEVAGCVSSKSCGNEAHPVVGGSQKLGNGGVIVECSPVHPCAAPGGFEDPHNMR